MKLFDFTTTPELCRSEFGAPSWATPVIARLIDGDERLLTPGEQARALKLTGRTSSRTGTNTYSPGGATAGARQSGESLAGVGGAR